MVHHFGELSDNAYLFNEVHQFGELSGNAYFTDEVHRIGEPKYPYPKSQNVYKDS